MYTGCRRKKKKICKAFSKHFVGNYETKSCKRCESSLVLTKVHYIARKITLVVTNYSLSSCFV